MRSTSFLLFAALVTGCDAGGAADRRGAGVPGAGEGPGAGMPAFCEPGAGEAVADATIAAEGFDFAPQAILDAASGSWGGDLVRTDEDGEPLPSSSLSLGLVLDGEIRVFRPVLLDDGSDTGMQMGAPQVDCAAYYEVSGSATLSAADGSLAESFPVVLRAHTADGASFSARVALADFAGSGVPSFDPAEWDAVELLVDGFVEGATLSGSATWSASRESEETSTFDTATGVGTGTVGGSGMSESAGGFSLSR